MTDGMYYVHIAGFLFLAKADLGAEQESSWHVD